MDFALLAVLTFGVLLGVPYAVSRNRRLLPQFTYWTFNPVGFIVVIWAVLMFCGVLPLTATTVLALVLLNEVKLTYKWER